jgi:glycosyltransferase involved in cell wall biosynthesis
LSKGYIIAFVGQIEPVRGVFLLLHAFRKLTKIIDNVQLVLSSPGQLYEEPYIVTFNKIVKKLQLEDRVVLLGPQRHLEEIYNLADIVVFPYIKPYYYMDPPLTLLEAMASGAVVVASAVGSANELVINGKNGILIKPKSVEALAEAIVDVIRNKDDYKSLGVNARETIVSKFSMNTVGSIMRQIYESIL